MSTAVVTPNSALQAFERARAQTHNPYLPLKAIQSEALLRTDSDSESVSSSIGCDDTVQPFKPQQDNKELRLPGEVVYATLPLPVLSRSDKVHVFAQAMTFLPLRDIEVARAADSVLAEAAAHVAPQPFGRSDITFVRWEPTEVPQPFKLPFRRAVPGTPSVFSWRCLSCGNVTHGPRTCGVCRAPISTSSCRVFLGQLRKDFTAELTAYMLRSVAPEINILHIESHTNPADGRGKGCAWVYVNSVEDAMAVVALHKRVFADVDADGYEGFWFAQNPLLATCLSRMADAVGSVRGRPQVLPRQPMVAELPAKSVLAEMVSATAPQ